MEYKELKPCPFCGGNAVEGDSDALGVAWVECAECGARSAEMKISLDYCAKDVAFNRWNRRADDE